MPCHIAPGIRAERPCRWPSWLLVSSAPTSPQPCPRRWIGGQTDRSRGQLADSLAPSPRTFGGHQLADSRRPFLHIS